MLLISHSPGSNPGSYIAFSCHIFLVSCVLEQFPVFVFHEIVIFVEYEPVVYWNPPKWCFLLFSYGEIWFVWLCSISFFQEH